MDIEAIQHYLNEHELDGWLLADFHGTNDIFMSLLELSGMLTRRAIYYIPAEGEPTALVNPIEKSRFDSVPGKIIPCLGYHQLEDKLRQCLGSAQRIAMEYSPKGRLPYVAKVDAGTVELVRTMVRQIVSSADLVAHFQARLTVEQMAAHRMAARNVLEIKDAAFAYLSEALRDGASVSEYDVCRFILEAFEKNDMVSEHFPNCSVNAHAGDPHYEPRPEGSSKISQGDLVLIDLWAKLNISYGIFADITWMAFAGTSSEIPGRYHDLFALVTEARDNAVAFLRKHIDNRPVGGYEVDDACREVIVKGGYGDFFTHRTGHSIGSSVHFIGPNIDNLETEDRRKLQKGHLFSIEPGIYLDDCGFRSEIDVLIGYDGIEVTTLPLQKTIRPLL